MFRSSFWGSSTTDWARDGLSARLASGLGVVCLLLGFLVSSVALAGPLGLPAVASAPPAPQKPTRATQKPAPRPPAKAVKKPTAVRPNVQAAKPAKPGASSQGPKLPGVDTSRRESELYGERLLRLEQEVADLKERVFRSKARLALLKETVLHGVMAGTRMLIAHRNLMTSQFRLVKVVYFLDGAQVYARSDEDGGLDNEDEVVIFDGNLVPGPHNVTIELTYRGRGSGLFSYLNGYVFESRSSHSLTAPENEALKLLSIGYERGNLTTEMKDRPAVSWQELGIDASGKPAGARRTKRKAKRTPAPTNTTASKPPKAKAKAKKKTKKKAKAKAKKKAKAKAKPKKKAKD